MSTFRRPRKTHLRLDRLEPRAMPAVLLHSLYPDEIGPQPGARFGASVAVGAEYRVVGADRSDEATEYDIGQAYVYDSANRLIAILDNPSPQIIDYFGASVAVSGNIVIVGAYGDNTGAFDAGAAYVYDMTSMTPTVPILTLNNPTPAEGDFFGSSVAVSGNTVIVGSSYDDTVGVNAGSSYVYDLNSTTPTVPIVTLHNPSLAPYTYFGYPVTVSGNTVVVGATYDDTGATNAGSAYVYDLSSTTPTVPIATLNNPSPAASDYFGNSVWVWDSIVVVAAPNDDTGATDAGTTYVYDLNSITPTVPIATLNNPQPSHSDFFGSSVAVSGNTAIVGAYNNSPGGLMYAGSAYVYDLNSITPTTPVLTIHNPAPANYDNFGSAVSVKGDAVLVAAKGDDTSGSDAGSVYVYDLNSITPTTPVAALQNASPAFSDYFGSAVATSGNIVVVGAYNDDTGAPDSGAAYVYNLASATPRTPIATLYNPSPDANDRFGASVAVSGNVIVVGAYKNSIFGSAFVYDLNSLTPTIPIRTLHAEAYSYNFGKSLAVSGRYVAIGLDGNEFFVTGFIFVYDLNSTTPTTPIARISQPANTYGFGKSVSVSGNRVVAGAVYYSPAGGDVARVYVYDMTSQPPSAPVATLSDPFPTPNPTFGSFVSLSGNYLAVGGGAVRDLSQNVIATAYAYDLNSITPTAPIATMTNPNPSIYNGFGSSVSASGTTVLIGASGDNAGASAAGSAYIYDLTSATPGTPVTILNNPEPAVNDLFGTSVSISGHTVVVGAIQDDTQNPDQGAAYVYALAASKVASVRISDGSAQRSRVTSLTVAFDQPVTFSGLPADAFQIRRVSDNAIVNLAASVINSGPGTVVTLTFTGVAVEFGSLADGRYILTIDASRVSNANGALDGDGNGTGGGNFSFGDAQGLFRFYGDMNGDRRVDLADFGFFSLAYLTPANYNAAPDFNNDGRIDITDFGQFSVRFFTTLP